MVVIHRSDPTCPLLSTTTTTTTRIAKHECLRQLGDIALAELMLTQRVPVSRSAWSWPGLLGQDARVVKMYLEHTTGRAVELVSVEEVPNIMFNMVPSAVRRLRTLAVGLGHIVVVYNPQNNKVAISPRRI